MPTERIISAFSFRREVYADVEKDTSFTNTAWMLVVVVAFLNQLGGLKFTNFFSSLIGVVIGTVFAVLGFAVACFVIQAVGRALFKADVTFEEMVRTLGLAYVWNVVRVIGILAAISPALVCVVAPITVIAAILLVVSWFVAAKEALDLEWVQTVITVIVGWIALMIVMAIAGAILGLLGLAAAGVGGLLTG